MGFPMSLDLINKQSHIAAEFTVTHGLQYGSLGLS